jgi:hypothetical protein
LDNILVYKRSIKAHTKETEIYAASASYFLIYEEECYIKPSASDLFLIYVQDYDLVKIFTSKKVSKEFRISGLQCVQLNIIEYSKISYLEFKEIYLSLIPYLNKYLLELFEFTLFSWE